MLIVLSLVVLEKPSSDHSEVSALVAEVKEGAKVSGRMAALDRAIALGSIDQRIGILDVMHELGEGSRRESMERLSEPEKNQRAQGVWLLRHFLDEGCLLLSKDRATCEALLTFLFEVATSDHLGDGSDIPAKAFERLVEVAPDGAVRAEYALAVAEQDNRTIGWLAGHQLPDGN